MLPRPAKCRLLKTWLTILGALVFAVCVHVLVHEFGHAVAGIATGASVEDIQTTPLGGGRTVVAYSAEHRALNWGGFVGETITLSLAFLILWALKSRLSFWAAATAGAALIGGGLYLLLGALLNYGDSKLLLSEGIGRAPLIALGAAAILAGLPLIPLAMSLLRLGRGNCPLWRTLLAVCPPVWLLLAFQLLCEHFWLLPYGFGIHRLWIGAAVALGVAIAGHFCVRWFRGRDTRRRCVPAQWRNVALSWGLAAAVVLLEVLAFPFPDDRRTEWLHQAIREGDLEAVQQRIADGVDVNAYYEGRTALHTALASNSPRAAEMLIAHGADANALSRRDGRRPLHWVAWRGYPLQLAVLLIDRGADIDARDERGLAPLHVASYKGDPELVELLIARGAGVNAVEDHYGFTPLHHTIAYGNSKIAEIELLIRHGADVNTRSSRGEPPLHWAVRKGDAKMVELLLRRGADVNARDDKGLTPLDVAERHCMSSSPIFASLSRKKTEVDRQSPGQASAPDGQGMPRGMSMPGRPMPGI